MPLPKQMVQFFFGATDQDASKKGVRLGDLVSAENMQQLHGGEFIQRGGIAQETTASWNGSAFAPDSISSPDGTQVLVRNAATDAVSLCHPTGARDSVGTNLRLFPKWPVLFGAGGEGEQVAPMPKQAGQFFVFLKNASTFVIAKLAADGENFEQGPVEIPVAGPGSLVAGYSHYGSTNISSFALVDNFDFDPTAAWVYWVDWSTSTATIPTQQNRDAVWAMKIPHSAIASPVFYQVHGGSGGNYCATTISAGIVGTRMAVCLAGCVPDAVGDYAFRTAFTGKVDTFCRNFYVNGDASTEAVGFSSIGGADTYGEWAASGCCLLTTPTRHYVTGKFYYAFWAGSAGYSMANLVLIEADRTTGATSTIYLRTGLTTEDTHNLGPAYCLVGQLTGHETATGVTLVGSLRAYVKGTICLNPSVNPSAPTGVPDDCYPDRILTQGWTFSISGGTPTLVSSWTERGSYLAQGWFMDDGVTTEMIVTGHEDPDFAQPTYHVRRLDTGAIIAQIAWAEASHCVGCATKTAQLEGHVSDIQQPALTGSGYPTGQNVICLQSQNAIGSVDIARLQLSKPTYQNPATWRDFVIYPGPIPVIAQGMQPVREAGPLLYPSRLRSYGSSGTS